jgi:hypothetical protein
MTSALASVLATASLSRCLAESGVPGGVTVKYSAETFTPVAGYCRGWVFPGQLLI